MKTYIIAEAGVNHNGDINIAFQLIEEAKRAGADCIKFQTFKANKLVSKNAEMANYQKKNTGVVESQQAMLKKLEMSYESFEKIKEYCDKIGIDFMSTAFDFDSVDFLSGFDMKYWKIPSGEITNLPYLEKIAKLNKPIILSTGMSTMNEIKDAYEVIKKYNNEDIIILHCTSEYPAPLDEVNLKSMETIKKEFNVEVGYSDHTEGIIIPVSAVAMGAKVIEKHFTLDKSMEGPDHKASLEPNELKSMIDNIRIVEKAFGDGVKKPTPSELLNVAITRKSIVANKPIKKGEIFTIQNITTKRPGTGITPMRWNELIGKRSSKDYKEDELIEL